MVTVPAAGEEALGRGQAIAEAFLSGEVAEVWNDLSPEMQQAFGGFDALGAFRDELVTNFGEEAEVLDENVEPGDGLSTYIRRSQWTESKAPIGMHLGITGDGTVVSFLVQPQPVLADSRFLVTRPKHRCACRSRDNGSS